MATVTFTFDLNDFDEKISAENALKADHLANIIKTHYDFVFRTALKYGTFEGRELTEKEIELLSAFANKSNEHLNEGVL